MQHYSDLIVIGSGMAAVRLVETLRRREDRRSITLLGAEASLPYNRILLSPLLAGDTDWQQVITHPADWYEENGVALRLGCAVSAVDTAAHTVTCGGETLRYGELVFATGADAARPPLPGIELPGVLAFRNLDDVTRLQRVARRDRDAVVLGGGLLGLEAAAALAGRGMRVTLVHRAATLMNRQLDETAAGYLTAAMTRRGIEVVTGVAPAAIAADASDSGAVAVELADGRRLPAELVVAAVGITPTTALALAAGISVKRGIEVDAMLATSAPDVYAVGECCEVNGETVGLVAPIWQQVEVLAARLCGKPQQYAAQPFVTMLKVSGIDVHVMGDIAADGDCRVLVFEDRDWGIYKKLVLRDGHVVGALLFGDVVDSQLFFSLIQRRAPIDRDHCRLLLAGQTPAEFQRASA